jgi:hypothetical protein
MRLETKTLSSRCGMFPPPLPLAAHLWAKEVLKVLMCEVEVAVGMVTSEDAL